MRSFLSEMRVMVLNANWVPINVSTPLSAIQNMAGTEHKEPSMVGIDMGLMMPVSWEQWLQLDPLDDVYYIASGKKRVRVPTVIIAHNYRGMPLKKVPFTPENVMKIHKKRCAYTGEESDDLNIDHVIPRGQGGEHNFSNTVPCKKSINTLKGNRTPEQAGLKLLHPPKVPKAVPVTLFIKNPYGIKDWDLFLKHLNS